LSAQPDEAKAQIQHWVPVGTSVTDAQHIMQFHGFTCSLLTNSMLIDLRGADYIDCERLDVGSVTQRRWQAALVLVEGKVSSVRVMTG